MLTRVFGGGSALYVRAMRTSLPRVVAYVQEAQGRWPEGPAHRTCAARVPASCVPYVDVPRTDHATTTGHGECRGIGLASEHGGWSEIDPCPHPALGKSCAPFLCSGQRAAQGRATYGQSCTLLAA